MADTQNPTGDKPAARRTRKTAAKADPNADLDLARDEPTLPVEPVTTQFPALDGTSAGREREIAQRSPDGETAGRFVKTMRIGRLAPADDDPLHVANAVGVVQEAMQRGLHARGDVYLTRVDEHDDPLNTSGTRRSQWTDLTYEVDVVPASIDTAPQDTTSPTVISQTAAASSPTSGGDGGDATHDADGVGDSS